MNDSAILHKEFSSKLKKFQQTNFFEVKKITNVCYSVELSTVKRLKFKIL